MVTQKKGMRALASFQNATGLIVLSITFLLACSSKDGEVKEEQISIQEKIEKTLPDSTFTNSIKGNVSLNEISSTPYHVVLTGLPQHRLVTVYKSASGNSTKSSGGRMDYLYSRSDYEEESDELESHYMPGIDLIYGYNLLNIAHYDLVSEKLNFLFDHPVLVKSLYYPSFVQDSLYKKPINRDYYLVSVYDADTNGDTLINKKDLRRFYYFNAASSEKVQLVPPAYSVIRSQYDPRNDVMYVFARQDTSADGMVDRKEPLHIFWFSLKQPAQAKRLY